MPAGVIERSIGRKRELGRGRARPGDDVAELLGDGAAGVVVLGRLVALTVALGPWAVAELTCTNCRLPGRLAVRVNELKAWPVAMSAVTST